MKITDLSFTKSYRLLKKDDFQHLKIESRRLFSGQLVFFYAARPEKKNTRLGISVSKRIGNAVRRNLIKRLIRETFRQSVYKNKSFDVLISISTRNFNKKNDLDFLNLKESISNDVLNGFRKISQRL